MYVIRRTDQGGGYLAVSGSESSYTHDLRNAQTFYTQDTAQAECCGNECPISLDSLLPAPGVGS